MQIEELLSGATEEMATAASVSMAPPPAPVPRSAWSRALPWAWAASTLGLAIALVLLWAPWRAGKSPRSTALRFTPLSFEQGGQTEAVWSPDGKAVAYGARQKETDPYQVYVRYLDSPVATQITHLAAGVSFPVEWTSAGRIVFLAWRRPGGTGTVVGIPGGRRAGAIPGCRCVTVLWFWFDLPGWHGSGLAVHRRRWGVRRMDPLAARRGAEAV